MTRDTLTIQQEPPRQPDVLQLLDEAAATSPYPAANRHHASVDVLEQRVGRTTEWRGHRHWWSSAGWRRSGGGEAHFRLAARARPEEQAGRARAPDATGNRRAVD